MKHDLVFTSLGQLREFFLFFFISAFVLSRITGLILIMSLIARCVLAKE